MDSHDRTERILNKDRPYSDKEKTAYDSGFFWGMTFSMGTVFVIGTILAVAMPFFFHITICR